MNESVFAIFFSVEQTEKESERIGKKLLRGVNVPVARRDGTSGSCAGRVRARGHVAWRRVRVTMYGHCPVSLCTAATLRTTKIAFCSPSLSTARRQSERNKKQFTRTQTSAERTHCHPGQWGPWHAFHTQPGQQEPPPPHRCCRRRCFLAFPVLS